MFCSHLARGLLVLGLCLVTVTGSVRIWQFYAMAAAFGLADAFFCPQLAASCCSQCSRATCQQLRP